MQRLEAGVAVDRRPLVDLEEACGGRGRAGEPPVGGLVDGGLEQLPHNAEGERLLELGALAIERGEARPLRGLARLARQLRLSHAGRALDEDQHPLADARAGEGRAQRLGLVLAFEQGRFPLAWHQPTLSVHCPLGGDNTGGKAGGSSLAAPARVRDRVSAVTSACEHNKEKVRLFVEAVLNEGRLELIDRVPEPARPDP